MSAAYRNLAPVLFHPILLVCLLISPLLAQELDSPPVCRGEPLGTSVAWYSDIQEACDLAEEQGKLVFLIHVSGNFAKAEFT